MVYDDKIFQKKAERDMRSSIFPHDSPFVKAMRASIDFDEGESDCVQMRHDRVRGLLSDPSQLSQLCSACFWASMEIEENRQVRGTLAICSPHPWLLARHLSHQIPVTVPVLVSLLTASPRAPLAVHGGHDGMHIWGMLDAAPEELLRLRITGNGTLQASQSGNVLALYQKGVVATPEAADVKSLGHLMARTLDKKQFLEIQSDIPARIIRMVTAMIHHGHGGTLVVVDPYDQSWFDSVRFSYTFGDASLGWESGQESSRGIDVCRSLNNYGSLYSGDADKNFAKFSSIKFDNNRLQMLDDSLFYRVAELSLVDGAVVIDMNLKLYGFGAKLELGQSNFPITALNAVTGVLHEGISLAQTGGMRHQSAACFVNNNRLADVFVVSQDGRLSLFCWSDKLQCVTIVHDLEHFIWEFQPERIYL